MPAPLPIDEILSQLTETLRQGASVTLQAPTGAGKTTRVPPSLLRADAAGGRRILVLEPRRIAARAAAGRIAQENGWRLGEEVGYQVRFDRRAGPGTRILIVTEGVLFRRLQSDPLLEEAGAVVFDEFHERNLASDLALAMLREVQQARRDLKIVVMSATLEAGPTAAFLDDCPILESRGRLYPLEIRYLSSRELPLDLLSLPRRVAAAVKNAADEIRGGILAFLPGVGEIRRTAGELQDWAERRGFVLAPLYGNLPVEKQAAALGRADRRKIVLATNVAETSVTVEGVEAVVDSGLARLLRFDPNSGLDRLELTPISKASADQRAGRAGREGPGLVLRLWSEHDHRGRLKTTPPEVARIDLAGPALQLLAWGEPDPAAFRWYEAPDPASLSRSVELLQALGALRGRSLTRLGKRMSQLPVHPRLARLLIEGARLGAPRRAALLAALLSERDPFGQSQPSSPPRTCRSDFDRLIEGMERFERGSFDEPSPFNRGAARFVLRVRDQLLRTLPKGKSPAAAKRARAPNCDGENDREALGRALLAAFPDRLARRRSPGDSRALMTGGRGVALSPESGVRDAELFVAVETARAASGTRAETQVRKACAVDLEWLPPQNLETRLEVEFDSQRERATAWFRTRFLDLTVKETEVAVPADEAERVLVEAASRDLSKALNLKRPSVASFLARVRCLRQWRPELGLPAFNNEDLRRLLSLLASGKRSFKELRQAPLLDFLHGALSFEQQQALERDAPERLQVPSGNRIRLTYEEGRPPVLPVRIQEVFGWRETPAVGGGRAPVLLHLLAPNFRPQQVTQDLASFWKNTYPQVRKELQGRYPKHAWPEDPLSAKPT